MGKDYSHKYLHGSRNETKTCSNAAKCNSATIEFEQCYNTDYNINETFPKFSMQCPLSHTRKGCYHYESSDRVYKGCVFEMEDKNWFSGKELGLRICFGDNCNSKRMMPRCLTCVSNQRNENCLSNLDNVQRNMCADMDDQCYIRVTDQNSFERGCLSSAPVEIQDECNSKSTNCETCDDPNHCNDRKLKYERCYVAEIGKNYAIILTPNQSQKCLASLLPLGCYHLEITGTKSNFVKKGCVANFREVMHLLANKHHLGFCVGNNCNSEANWHT